MVDGRTVQIARVYVDGSLRGDRMGWGAVICIEGDEPHTIGGKISGSARNSDGVEAVAALLAKAEAQRWLRGAGIKAAMISVLTDSETVAEGLSAHHGSKSLVFRWISREHPMIRLAHERARMEASTKMGEANG